ncbi:hypothetical protein [Sporosarcina cascadiensis]|uniref:hypothetical protein n=1 Tax=Sporosarcina cascadiensis TaxID=2660747 RepID=UPI001891E3D2|nr:hypothetical protein [Sporosarcina cascadiensis]
MRIQSSLGSNNLGYVGRKHDKEQNEGISHLFLDEEEKKTSGKPRFEVRNEGGYIRKYVVKANGDKILVMETKQKENPDGTVENESGDPVDIAHDLLMKQLEVFSDHQKEKNPYMSSWETENSITKYKTGI